MPTIEVHAVIFDLDGLLLDTEPILRLVDREAVAYYGAVLTDDLHQRALGLTHEEKDRLLVRELHLPVDPSTLGAIRTERLNQLWATAHLMPGAAALVASLAALQVPMAIATSSTTSAMQQKLATHPSIRSAMQAIVTADHPLVQASKPAPDVFLVAIQELGVDPAHGLAFEDAPSGVEAALAAGLRVIAVPDPELPWHPSFNGAYCCLPSLLAFDPLAVGVTFACSS